MSTEEARQLGYWVCVIVAVFSAVHAVQAYNYRSPKWFIALHAAISIAAISVSIYVS